MEITFTNILKLVFRFPDQSEMAKRSWELANNIETVDKVFDIKSVFLNSPINV